MAGQPVTTLTVRPDFFDTQYDVLCTLLPQLAAAVPAGQERRVLVPVPASVTSLVAERDRLQRHLGSRGVACPATNWSNPYLESIVLGGRRVRVDFAYDSDLRFRGDRYRADLLVLRQGPYWQLDKVDRYADVRQALVLQDHPTSRRRTVWTPAPRPHDTWGEMPTEVLLAGGPL